MKNLSRKYYLIDTENVGNRWLDMPHKIRRKDKIVTFYTKNHSKHLEKFLSKQVHNPRILWLECAAGENALDYQLIGVLSYLIAKHPKSSFCIYSNDKDYHDTVEFWKSRGIKICQKGYKLSKKKKRKKKKEKASQSKKALANETNFHNPKLTDEQYLAAIAKSIPVSNMAAWHQALTTILGQEEGLDWYLKFKDDMQLRKSLSAYFMTDAHLRGVSLVATTLNRYDLDVDNAEEAYKIILCHNPENLSAIKNDFDKKFNQNPPQRYYRALRPLFRTLKELQLK